MLTWVICGFSTGHTYERAILQEWFRRCKNEPLSPQLSSKMASRKVVPADALRSAIIQALRGGNSQVGDSSNLYTSTRAHARAHTHTKTRKVSGRNLLGLLFFLSLRAKALCICVSLSGFCG